MLKPPASRAGGNGRRQSTDGMDSDEDWKGQNKGLNKQGKPRNPERHKGYEPHKDTYMDIAGDVLDEGMMAAN